LMIFDNLPSWGFRGYPPGQKSTDIYSNCVGICRANFQKYITPALEITTVVANCWNPFGSLMQQTHVIQANWPKDACIRPLYEHAHPSQ